MEYVRGMRLLFSTLLALSVLAPASAHPHEWVDWGAGVVWDGARTRVAGVQLELTWDQWLSELVLADFPAAAQGPLSPADLAEVDAGYGLGSPNRASSLSVTWQGRPVAVKPVLTGLRTDGRAVTLVYSLALNLALTAPSELRVELYDPTYYADMGIRSRAGGFFVGVKDPASFGGTFVFRQDKDHPYFAGSVYPEVVVFSLTP